eukprot:Pgem_evm1s6919
MEDAINCMLYPMGVYNPGYVYSCILSTSAISGFHLYHIWPLMFLTAYVGLAGLFRGGLNDQPSYMIGLMILGTILHSFNAVYYCDKVVGNYHIKKNEKTDGLKDDKNDKEENKRECENSKLNMVH